MGAALGTVGGTCDRIENLEELKNMEGEKPARVVALERGREIARLEAIRKGVCVS